MSVLGKHPGEITLVLEPGLLGYILDFCGRVGKKPFRRLHPGFDQIILDAHPLSLLEHMADVTLAEIQTFDGLADIQIGIRQMLSDVFLHQRHDDLRRASSVPFPFVQILPDGAAQDLVGLVQAAKESPCLR